jgi:hypothetical protein
MQQVRDVLRCICSRGVACMPVKHSTHRHLLLQANGALRLRHSLAGVQRCEHVPVLHG